MYNMGSAKVDRWMVERTVHNSEYLNFRRAGNPGMRNSRSRPFPGMKPLIPSPELWEWSFSIPPRSRSFGMELSVPVPELPKVIPSHPCGNQTDDTSIPDICYGSHGYTRVNFFWPV